MVWLGAIAFLFQIYYDFSGYSDMAIGLCRIFGFRIKKTLIFLIQLHQLQTFEDGTYRYHHGLKIIYTYLWVGTE